MRGRNQKEKNAVRSFTRKVGRSQFGDGKINPPASRRTQSDEIVKKRGRVLWGRVLPGGHFWQV